MSETSTLNRVFLSFPTMLQLAATNADDPGAPRSWIQLARTGSFVSNRYGKFSITRADLSQMLKNFNEVTPKAPTELPVDWDHLSMDPKKPGDGAAAGWFKGLELRGDGEELWGEVEWTPKAADAIRSKEYRFVSPSFVKDHTHKDGKKIGTTLLAAAITNHPFLENMNALTLYSFATMGDLALNAPPSDRAGRQPTPVTWHLTEIEQRVTFLSDPERSPELSDEERTQTFLAKSIVGEGDDQFVRLATLDGNEFGWFRATQLAPANAPQKDQNSPLPESTAKEDTMSQLEIETRAAQFAQRVSQRFSETRDWARAFDLAQNEDEAGAQAHRLAGLSLDAAWVDAKQEAGLVLSLSARAGESFDDLAARYAIEKNVPLRQAIHEVGRRRPDLAATR